MENKPNVSFKCQKCKYYWYEEELEEGKCPNCQEQVI